MHSLRQLTDDEIAFVSGGSDEGNEIVVERDREKNDGTSGGGGFGGGFGGGGGGGVRGGGGGGGLPPQEEPPTPPVEIDPAEETLIVTAPLQDGTATFTFDINDLISVPTIEFQLDGLSLEFKLDESSTLFESQNIGGQSPSDGRLILDRSINEVLGSGGTEITFTLTIPF